MTKKLGILCLLCAMMMAAFVGSASAQDTGTKDTLRLVTSGDWVVGSAADSLYTIEVWVWADETVSGVSVPFVVSTSGAVDVWSSRVDTAMAVDTLIKDGAITAQTFTYRRSVLSNVYDYKTADIDTTKDFVGCLIGLVNIFPASQLWAPSTSVKMGDLVLKMKNWDKLPKSFTIDVDSAFYPPAGAFKFSVTGQTGFAPEFTKASIAVQNPLAAGEEIEQGEPLIPKAYQLSQNYPNPFNPSTTVKFYNAQKGHVNLTIYNIMGQRVRTLVDQDMDIGWQEAIWDGLDNSGGHCSSGLYFYKMDANDYSQTKKMLMIK